MGLRWTHTLTAIIYAIVKNVVIPARISVTNLEPLLSFGYTPLATILTPHSSREYTLPDPSRRNTLPKVDFATFSSKAAMKFLIEDMFNEYEQCQTHGGNVERGQEMSVIQ